MSRSKRLVLVCVAIVGLAGAVILVTSWLGSAGTAGLQASTTSPSAAPQALTAQGASELAANLTSGNLARVRLAVDLPADQPLDQAAVSALHSTGAVTFELSSFHATGSVAVVTAHVASTPPQVWTVHLVAVNGGWKISSTEQQ